MFSFHVTEVLLHQVCGGHNPEYNHNPNPTIIVESEGNL